MWQQICSLPDVRGATATRLTAIHFPDPAWRELADTVRVAAPGEWLERALRPSGEDELQQLLEIAVWRAAQDFKLRSIHLSRTLDEATRELQRRCAPWWRKLVRGAMRSGPARALRARLR